MAFEYEAIPFSRSQFLSKREKSFKFAQVFNFLCDFTSVRSQKKDNLVNTEQKIKADETMTFRAIFL